jgi:hypothetical protein
MHHIHEFRGNFGQPAQDLRETDSHIATLSNGVAIHDADSSVRNVCFVWDDGRRAFFNYAYLVSVDLVLTDSLNVMLLYFSGQIVTLKGYQLGLLFDLLLNHIPKTIIASHPRYFIEGQTSVTVVTEIAVKSE